jgi:hypothetical protein
VQTDLTVLAADYWVRPASSQSALCLSNSASCNPTFTKFHAQCSQNVSGTTYDLVQDLEAGKMRPGSLWGRHLLGGTFLAFATVSLVFPCSTSCVLCTCSCQTRNSYCSDLFHTGDFTPILSGSYCSQMFHTEFTSITPKPEYFIPKISVTRSPVPPDAGLRSSTAMFLCVRCLLDIVFDEVSLEYLITLPCYIIFMKILF